jgi:hypothetical protein
MRVLPLVAFLLPRLAIAQGMDAGPSDGGGPCGAVTTQGSCNGNVVTYCDTNLNQVVTYDCTMRYTATSRCVQIDPTLGYRCAEAAGNDCTFNDRGTSVTLFCQGNAAGCLDSSNHEKCAENIGPCTTAETGSCKGNRLVFHCMENQPYLIDCASYMGTCAPQHCTNIPTGGPCSATFSCAIGLQCVSGFCLPTQLPDAGEAPADTGVALDGGAIATPDSGTGSSGSKSGCSCAMSMRDPHSMRRSIAELLVLGSVFFVCTSRGRRAQRSGASKASKPMP